MRSPSRVTILNGIWAELVPYNSSMASAIDNGSEMATVGTVHRGLHVNVEQ